ncbi:MAG TPA: menaquinone biosynthesis protein [Planctomycetota bacterium]|nr:menaquinone biosynthesis protein [Planctomycetota bacterium]
MIRIGSVPYLNSKVLVYGLQPRTPEYTFESHVPSLLTQKLREGSIDVALVSSIEYFRNPDYCILPDLSVSAHREMWSIKLFHRVPLKSARRVALDPSSETTNALLQIILQEKMQLGIELVKLQHGEDPLQRADIDGFLKIGDPCLSFVPPADYSAVDLAAEWHSFTSLPFVFAVWLARKGVDLEGINKNLFMAKREGLRHTDEIARVEAPKIGLDYLRAKQYISRIVHYDLARFELGGLDLFRRYLVRQGLVPHGSGFDFYTR